jgi:hypothetical protein
MKNKRMMFAIICLILAPMGALNVHAQDRPPLQRVETIPMPNLSGRMDHLGVDIEGARLFAAALGASQNTVEAIHLKAGKRVFSIPGQSMPQLIQTQARRLHESASRQQATTHISMRPASASMLFAERAISA